MNKHGQSIIEYALIAVLVVTGIVVMGPYVLRSVNAHFKLWGDSVQDSYQEKITQAPLGDLPPINATCTCNYSKGSCGGNGSLCPTGQVEYDYNCAPIGCNGATKTSYCQYDPSCCTTYVPQGCGTAPCPSTGCNQGSTAPPQGANKNNCYYGYQILAQQCGGNTTIECSLNSSCPLPTCRGITSTGSLYCATGTQTAPTGLLQDTGITYETDQSKCPAPSASTCQMYCDASNGYQVNSKTFPTGCVLAPQCDAACPQCLPGTGTLNASYSQCYDGSNPQAQCASGQNYFFFNRNNHCMLAQTVDFPTSGMNTIIPGSQTYHLRLVSGQDASGNNCVTETHNNISMSICDAEQLNYTLSPNVLYYRVYDHPTHQATYTWQILDQNYNEVFQWTGDIDYFMDVAFIACPISSTYASSNCVASKSC